jgi:trimeric autotransporter adhesin
MSVKRHTFSLLTSIILLAGTAAAQGVGGQTPARSAVVATASAEASGVRFVSPGGARRVRLEVYTAAGERLFDSGFRAGSIADWDASGVADGSYLGVLTSEDLTGKLGRGLSGVTLQGGRAAVRREAEGQLKAEFAQALAAADQVFAASEAAGGQAATVTAHDGADGQVTSTTGALTFRTGDVFSGREREQMRVTPEGRVGIGTNAPEDTLDVAGTIRARGGIRFDDGTVLTSARGASSSKVSVNSLSAGAAGTGTPNKLTKWIDGVGTVGDSTLSESGGNLVIDGSNLQMTAAPTTQRETNLHFLSGSNQTTGFAAGPAPTYLATNGPYFVLRGNAFTTYANQRGLLVFSAGKVTTPVGNEGSVAFQTGDDQVRMMIKPNGNVGIGTNTPVERLEAAGNIKVSGAGNGIIFPDGTKQTTAGGAGSMTGTAIVSAINDAATAGVIGEARLSPNVAKLNAQNNWTGQNTFNGLSMNGTNIVNVANPVSATDATNKAYVDANTVKFVPGAEQLSVGDANGTAPMINLRGGSTCCSGPGGHTPAWFKVFQNGSFVATGNLGIGVSPMQGKGYRTSWDSYKGAFRSGYADNEWDDANVGFFSWAGGSNSTAIGLYALAFGDTNSAESTSSIVFGSGNQVKGAAGFSAGAGNRVCDTYGVALGNNAKSGGPLINGKCDPDTFNIRGLAAVAIGYNVTADQDHTTAMGKFASNNGFTGTFIWSDGSAQQSADTFRNTANNEFAARATGGFRFRTNLTGTTGCNLPAGSGVFNCTSSRTTKENFFSVDGNDVLARLRKVPVSTWNYIAEGQQSRHLGPMAEDFYSAFQLGTTDKAIGIQDAVGVSLAAVKALDARTMELQQKTAEVEQLRSKVNTLEQRLAALEQLVQKQAEGQQK